MLVGFTLLQIEEQIVIVTAPAGARPCDRPVDGRPSVVGGIAGDGPHRFTVARWSLKPPTHLRGRPVDICPLCVAEGERGYLPLLWLNGWAGVCPSHRTILTGWCPSCLGVLRIESLKAKKAVDLGACRKCGARLDGDEAELAHPVALALQERLLAGKQSGTVVLPGIGVLAWSVIMALCDVLLAMVWAERPAWRRQRLYDRIARDVGIDEDARLEVPWSTNYGGLLILGWLLEDFDARLSAAVAILAASKRDGLIAAVPDIDADTANVLRDMFKAAVPRSAQNRRAWREWVASLPEGEELRQRARNERFKLRRQRLFAFAAVRDGVPVEDAAAHAQVTVKTLYRWMLRGALEGLEAALERPRRESLLSGAEAEELAQWVSESRARQNREMVIGAAAAMFGIDIPPDQAQNLLRVHGSGRRGKRPRRRWSPRARRRT